MTTIVPRMRFFLRTLLSLLALAAPALSIAVDARNASTTNSSAQAPSPVVETENGTLFLTSELRFLQFPTFWAEAALKAARSPKPENADPLPAIVDFHKQLAEMGIRLLLVPVPPKAWYAKFAPEIEGELHGRQTDSLSQFYARLAEEGVQCIDLRPSFAQHEAAGEAMYCKTDSHWSGAGCVVAAQTVATQLAALQALPASPASPPALTQRWSDVQIKGDLLEWSHASKTTQEALRVREITLPQHQPLSPDVASPILILGDSHTLVFHDFLAEHAGFPDQIALESGRVPDWIGTRGSGANAVRVSLFRRNLKDASYLAGKKVVIWCFAAREFTEAEQGWQKIPLTPRANTGK